MLFQNKENKQGVLSEVKFHHRHKICRLSSDTKCLHSIADSQEVELKKLKTDMATLQTELTHSHNEMSVQTERLSAVSTNLNKTNAELRSAMLDIYILHLVIWQTLLSKATYNWGIHKAIHLEEAIRQRKCS